PTVRVPKLLVYRVRLRRRPRRDLLERKPREYTLASRELAVAEEMSPLVCQINAPFRNLCRTEEVELKSTAARSNAVASRTEVARRCRPLSTRPLHRRSPRLEAPA